MKNHKVIAKLSRPESSRLLNRERLFQKIDNGRSIVWVSAPPGAGKTSLISSYVKARNLPCIWYQADAGDADPATFFYFMGRAAQMAAPKFKNSLPSFTPEYQHGIEAFAFRFFEIIFSRIRSPSVLVIDNYQEIPENSPVNNLVRIAAELLTEGIRLIILSRADSCDAFARIQLYEAIEKISANDMRLTLDEAESLAVLRQDNRSQPIDIQYFHKLVQGWTAGLVLLLEQAGQLDSQVSNFDFSSYLHEDLMHQVLFDYFAKELLEHCSTDEKAVLLKTALPPQLTLSMAEQLSGVSTAALIIDQLMRRNYFIVKRTQDEPVYEYHPLFRTFLLNMARHSLTSSEYFRLQKQSAELLQNNGQVDAAAGLFIEAKAWQSLVNLILAHIKELIGQGRNQTLLQWFECIPESILNNTAWLLYWRGVTNLPFDPESSRCDLEQSFALFDQQDEPGGLYFSWAGIMESLYFCWSDADTVELWFDKFHQLRSRHSEFPSLEVELHIYCALGILSFSQADLLSLAGWDQRCLELMSVPIDANLQVLFASQLIFYYIWSGQSSQVTNVQQRVRLLASKRTISPISRIMYKSSMALYYSSHGDVDQALNEVMEGKKISQETGVHVMDAILLSGELLARLTEGNTQEADKILHSSASVEMAKSPINQAQNAFFQAWSLRQQGQLNEAWKSAQYADECLARGGAWYPHAFVNGTLSSFAFALGDEQTGYKYLKRTRQHRNPIFEYIALMIEACAAFDQNRELEGLDKLRAALGMCREIGSATWCLWGAKVMATLLERALIADIEVPLVSTLIHRLKLSPPNPLNAPEIWPWPLKIFTLGQFSVMEDGVPLVINQKLQKKPLELLQLLIAKDGQDVPVDSLTDLLWPDAEGDAAYRSLITTLKRLRQWLGDSEAIELSGSKLRINNKRVWIDVWRLDHMLKETSFSQHTANDESIDKLEQVLDLYRGPFLKHVDQPWAASMRKRIVIQFCHYLIAAGMAYESSGQWDQAIQCYRHGLETGENIGLFNDALLRCYENANFSLGKNVPKTR